MAQFSYGENGEMIVHSKYTRSGVLTLNAIFPNDRYTTAKLIKPKKQINIVKTCEVDYLSHFVRIIFFTCLKEILERVADGDVFLFPGTTGANISLKKTPDKEIRLLRQLGKFAEIDIVKSRFNIPRFTFDFGPKYTRKDRQIYVPTTLSRRAFKNVENGSITWTEFRKILNYDNRNG